MTELQEGLVAPAAVADPARPVPENKVSGASRARSVLKHIVMIAVSFVMIYPLLWLLVVIVGVLTAINFFSSKYWVFYDD